MKSIWSIQNRETDLSTILVPGRYYDLKTYRGTRGAQIYKGVVDGLYTFYNQFAHDEFGGIDTYSESDFIRIWE